MAIVPTLDLVARPKSHGYDGVIDNVLIRLAVTPQTPFEDVTAEATPPRVDTSETAEDVKDEVGQRYSRSDFSGGAGLDFLHERSRPDDADIRFWDSKDVDVFSSDRGKVYESVLMHAVEEVGNSWTDVVAVQSISGVIYYLRAGAIWSNPSSPSNEAALSNATAMVAMGNSLYTLDPANGVRKYPVSTFTPESISATIYDDIWAAKSRIFASDGNDLYDTSAETTPVLSIPTGETFHDVIDVGPAVLAFTSSGSIHALTLDQDLSVVTAGETKFVDEIPLMAVESFGMIGLVTAEPTEAGGKVARFYTAELGLSGGYELANIQLIYQRGDRTTTKDLTPHAIHGTRDSIYCAIPEEDSDELTLWRYYLPTAGYARAHTFDPAIARTINNFIEVDDRMWIAVAGDDLWQETDEYVAEGYVIGPLADFFTSDDKQWVGADITGGVTPVGGYLELYDTTNPALILEPDSTSWRLVHQLASGDTTNTTQTLTGRSSRFHAAKLVWRSPATRIETPSFQSYSFRALPAPQRDILLRIPINVSDQIESRGRRATRIPGRGKALEDALRAYEGKHVLIELYRPELEIRGLIEKFESTIQTIPNQGSVRSVMYARIRGTRLTDKAGYGGAVQTDGASLGQDILGIAILGIGEIE